MKVNGPPLRQSPGFLGYWGWGVQSQLRQRLADQLSRLPTATLAHLQTSPSYPDRPHWQVAYWGDPKYQVVNPLLSSQSAEEGCQVVVLSASGLRSPTLPYGDAWIRINRAGDLEWGCSPFGQVSLYWLQQESAVWFASRLQYLLPLLNSRSVDLAALYGYACFSYVPVPLTPLQEIQRGVPGEQQRLHWSAARELIIETTLVNGFGDDAPASATLLADEEAAVTQLQTLLKAAILRQVEALPAGPVGLFLSGGLDSSIVAALLVQAGIDVRAYSLDFGQEEITELPYAREVANYLGIPLITVAATPDRIRHALRATTQALDLPFGDGVTVPLYLLNQAAAADTKVVFNGENGDQLFAGWTNKPLITAGLYHQAQASPSETFAQQYLKTFHRLYGYEAQTFTPMVQDNITHLDPKDWLQSALGHDRQTLLQRLRRATLMLKGAQNIQPRATQLAFAHGLQVRSPFCDPDLTRWTFGLADDLFLRGTCEKYILKRAAENWLPPTVVWRKKRGMGVPLTFWCFNALWPDLGRWLNPARLRAEGLWQAQLPAKIVFGQLGGIQGRRMGEVLWLLVMWQHWRQAHLGETFPGYTLDHPFWLPRRFWQTFKMSGALRPKEPR